MNLYFCIYFCLFMLVFFCVIFCADYFGQFDMNKITFFCLLFHSVCPEFWIKIKFVDSEFICLVIFLYTIYRYILYIIIYTLYMQYIPYTNNIFIYYLHKIVILLKISYILFFLSYWREC